MMDCTGFRKFAGAFADGELDVRNNLEALEHLNMCPSCVKRVEEVTALKAALKRGWEDIGAPEALHNRVETAIQAEDGGGDWIGRPKAVRGPSVYSRFIAPIAAAAALLIAVSAWYYGSSDGNGRAGTPMLSEEVVANVRQQHRMCVRTRGLNHHDASLSRDLATIAERLSQRLDLQVIAPDLSSAGLNLVGADVCGIVGRRGSHLLYRASDSGIMLSLYTVDRIPVLRADTKGEERARGYFSATDESLTVVAWHDDRVTHVACGEIEQSDLIAALDPIRTASLPPQPPSLVRVASAIPHPLHRRN